MNLVYIKAIFLLLFFCIISRFALAQPGYNQQQAINSLYEMLQQHPKEDSVRVELMIQLSGYYQSEHLTKAEFFAATALNTAFKTRNYLSVCAAMSQLGSVYSWQRATAKALNIYFRQKELATSIRSKFWLQDAYLGIGYIYELENDWNRALKYTIQALPYAEQSSDPVVKAFAYTNLGAEYTGLGNLEQADYYLNKAATLYYDNDYIEQFANNEINIARLFIAKKEYDSAKYHFRQADSIFTVWDEPYQIADVCQQLGDMYVLIQEYELAKECYIRTINNYNKNDISRADYALAVMGLGVVAWSEKKFDTAARILHEEFPKVKEANIIGQQLNYLKYMAKTDSALGNFAEAYHHTQEYLVLNDRFNNEEKAKVAQRMMIEFGVQEKEKENEQLKMQNSMQKQRTILFAVTGLVLLVAGIYLASIYRQKAVALAAVKELQLSTETKNKDLAIINGVRDKLISMIAHDVRAPLTSLQNTLYLTQEKIINEEEFMQLSRLLDNDISHLISMLDNTLLWARDQIYVLNVAKAGFNLYEIADDVIALYKKPLQDKNILVKNDIPTGLEVVSDREIIHTVLRNVLSNAIKFTPPGKQISLYTHQNPDEVIVHIKDEGAGIAYNILEKISKKEFISTRGTNNEKGTGLGLMFSYDLLAKLNESLTIRTEPGEGTTVIFSITPPAAGAGA